MAGAQGRKIHAQVRADCAHVRAVDAPLRVDDAHVRAASKALMLSLLRLLWAAWITLRNFSTVPTPSDSRVGSNIAKIQQCGTKSEKVYRVGFQFSACRFFFSKFAGKSPCASGSPHRWKTNNIRPS